MHFDFDALYAFHGHRCPMSTMGARMGMAAMEALGLTKADQFIVEARCFARNCALDGVQFTTGCTLGNGNISFEDAGKTLLALRRRDGSREVSVSMSAAAAARFAENKHRRAGLLAEREISGLPRAMEIDALVEREFRALIKWVQEADAAELLEVERNKGA